MKKAVVLLSGGMDSATCLYWAKMQGFSVHALTVRYGQRHEIEVQSAQVLARQLPAHRHLILDFDLRLALQGSALMTASIPIPERDGLEEKDGLSHGDIPITYVPARNTILLSLALGWAETLNAHDLVIGVNAVDYSGYPDCRPEFIAAFERLANLATKAGVEGRSFHIHAPLIGLSKEAIIRFGNELGVDFAITHSCYAPIKGHACGRCDACRLRLAGFAAAGLVDPVFYG